jgi:ethanolamine utilization protein EutA (predicted chaperonin)
MERDPPGDIEARSHRSSLHLELRNARREKLLWLRVDGGYDLLELALERALPGRFEAIDAPIG